MSGPHAEHGTRLTDDHDIVRMSIFLRSSDTQRGRPLAAEIVDRARAAGLPGASVVRGLQGFGGSGRVHSAGWAGRGDGVPVLIEIVAAEARIRAFLPVLDELTGTGLVILRPVTLTRPGKIDVRQVTIPLHGERGVG
jgi:uncharacterized protein